MAYIVSASNELEYDWNTFKKTWRRMVDPLDRDFIHFNQIITGKIWFNQKRISNIKNIIYLKVGKQGRVSFNDTTANMFIYDAPFTLKVKVNNRQFSLSSAVLLQNFIDNLIKIIVSVNANIKIIIVNKRDECLEYEKENKISP